MNSGDYDGLSLLWGGYQNAGESRPSLKQKEAGRHARPLWIYWIAGVLRFVVEAVVLLGVLLAGGEIAIDIVFIHGDGHVFAGNLASGLVG